MASAWAAEAVGTAARRLGTHPYDLGWRELYRLFGYGLADRAAPQLTQVVTTARATRPDGSDPHLVTMLGIAVKTVAGEAFPQLVGEAPAADRLALLERLLERHRPQIETLLSCRQNSFTGARRFLVPQVLLAAYFAGDRPPARVADLGTGLGLLPRQLNAASQFDRFAPDLAWPGGQPAFRMVPLAARYGVDRPPLPDLAWVRECHGRSGYYREQYRELTEVRRAPEVQDAAVCYVALDLADQAALRRFLVEQRINTVLLCYVLYEIAPATRAAILATLRESLSDPGLVVVTEPHAALSRPGCTVTVWDHDDPDPSPVCEISDGHFRGQVAPLAGYHDLVRRYPIPYQPPTDPVRAGAGDAAPYQPATG